MIDRQRTPNTEPEKPLLGWESWPLWALGLSNGLNIVLWYVLSMTRVRSPELPIGVLTTLATWLPLIVVAGGVAQALSLDGALIATIAGARHGRVGIWTWLTIVGAGLFSAAISYAVHSGRIDQLPILHVASAVNLVFYNLHLAQPRKPLQPHNERENHGATWFRRDKTPSALAQSKSQEAVSTTVKLYSCRACGATGFDSLGAVNLHKKTDCPKQQN